MPRLPEAKVALALEAEVAEMMEDATYNEVAKFLSALVEELEETGDVITVKRKLAGIRKFVSGV